MKTPYIEIKRKLNMLPIEEDKKDGSANEDSFANRLQAIVDSLNDVSNEISTGELHKKIKIGLLCSSNLLELKISKSLYENNSEQDKRYYYEFTSTSQNIKEFIRKFRLKLDIPDVLIIPFASSAQDEFHSIDFLKKHLPRIKILPLLPSYNFKIIDELLKKGFNVLLTTQMISTHLNEAIYALLEENLYIPEKIAIHVVASTYGFKSPEVEAALLNAREIEFLKLVCTEMTYKEIAEKMFISARTIDGYRDALFEKLNVKSRVGLVLYAIQNNIVQVV